MDQALASSAAGLTRRGVLRLALGLAGGAVAAETLAPGLGVGRLFGAAAAEAGVPFSAPLHIPPVLRGGHIELTARPAAVSILPGRKTAMWTFNGSFPGPTIRLESGEATRLTVRHALPKSADTLTIHHHGGHQPTGEDGQPGVNVIAPGHRHTYRYGLRDEHRPVRAAMNWYHDHSHFRTAHNTWRGLAGMVIVDDAFERKLQLPAGKYELPLLITDRSFDKNNQLTDPFPPYDENSGPSTAVPNDDIFGDTFLVNGVPQPYVVVEPRRYRLRVLNASVFRVYNLALSDGSELTQIGSDGGLLPKAATVRAVMLGPGERADIVIDFGKHAGRKLRLASVPRAESSLTPRSEPATAELMEFRVRRGQVADHSEVPHKLRPLPAWVDELSDQPDRVWAFGMGVDPQGRTAWTINGQAFDHHRVDARPKVGSTETWMLVNTSQTSHYVHIHDVAWYVISRNGAAPGPAESGLKDTFRVDPGEVVVIGTKFTDFVGTFLIHCHMLQHEDHGMMTAYEVVGAGQGDRQRQTPDLSASLAASIPSSHVRAHVRRVVGDARHGRPASPWLCALRTPVGFHRH